MEGPVTVRVTLYISLVFVFFLVAYPILSYPIDRLLRRVSVFKDLRHPETLVDPSVQSVYFVVSIAIFERDPEI